MNLPDEIKTIQQLTSKVFKEKASEFFAFAFPIKSQEEFKSKLEGLKKEHYNANHHCFAFKLKDQSVQYSDDGEPKGTAGIRILNAIDHFELSDIAIVVVRYFGGTKLGVGPLGKAYYNSAYNVLADAKMIFKYLFREIILEFDFNSLSHVHHLLNEYKAIVTKQEFYNINQFQCLVRNNVYKEFCEKMTNFTSDKVKLIPQENYTYL